jgi:competence protein ComGB
MMRFLTKKARRLSRKQTHALLATFTILLESGFSLQESLRVLLRSGQFDQEAVKAIDLRLTQGQRLKQAFSLLHLSEAEQNQLDLAETHGNLIDTLRRMVAYQTLLAKQNQTLQKVLAYPLLLLVFVFTALFAMRQFLLPQLLASGMIDRTHWGIRFITNAPWIGAILFGGLGVAALALQGIYSKQTAVKRAAFLSRLPFFGQLYRCYQTSYFALEWGKLFQQGLEIRQIILCMQQTSAATLVQELAAQLEQCLANGGLLPEKLKDYPFLTPEFSLIVFQGEMRGKLGEELFVYSQLLTDRLFHQIEKKIQWIQPVIFLFVALLIVGVYAAMFLPIYGNIQGVIE